MSGPAIRLKGGYSANTLRVNLNTGTVRKETIPDDVISEYIGGKGLGTKTLHDELQRGIDPLGPENKLIFTVGPFTATSIPTTSRYGIYFKSPLTGIYGESYSGGFWAPEFKKAGCDMMIIEGKAPKPMYISVVDDSVELKDARHFWGLDTHDTEDGVKKEVGEKGVRVAAIGPAGEKLVRFACICNDYGRQAGRCGAGAVMGSKNLKAVAVRGTKPVGVHDEDKLRTFVKELITRMPKDLPLSAWGTPVMVNLENKLGTFPTRYWHKGFFKDHAAINADAVKSITVSRKACFNCPIACGKLVRITEGKYSGTEVEGPEYETIYSIGGLCEIADIKAVAKANDLCDRLGIDTMETGNAVGLAIEACELGKMKMENRIRYGDADAALDLIEKIGRREGPTATILSEGVRGAANTLGMSEIAIHVKGLVPAGYDPRGLKGMGLGFAVATIGASHLRSNIYAPESRGIVDRFTIEGKPALLKDLEDRMVILDSLIACHFGRDLFFNWDDLVSLLQLVTGKVTTKAELQEKANRTVTTARKFNLREGISRKDDTLPKRFMEEPLPEGGSQGSIVKKEELNKMVDDYYSLRGWTNEGIPPK
jgi:aldehyde:ferredoxin oxidoreductase